MLFSRNWKKSQSFSEARKDKSRSYILSTKYELCIRREFTTRIVRDPKTKGQKQS